MGPYALSDKLEEQLSVENKLLGGMDMGMFGTYLKSPELIWNFQSLFGVEKCGVVEGGGGEQNWLALDASKEGERGYHGLGGSNGFTRTKDKGIIACCTLQVNVLKQFFKLHY